jgi:hypothetical protein
MSVFTSLASRGGYDHLPNRLCKPAAAALPLRAMAWPRYGTALPAIHSLSMLRVSVSTVHHEDVSPS